MKTSLTEMQQIEKYLYGTADDQDTAVLEVRLLLEPGLKQKLQWQSLTYQLIRSYGRKKLKAEIEAAHHKLFSQPEHISFRRKIYSYFSRYE